MQDSKLVVMEDEELWDFSGEPESPQVELEEAETCERLPPRAVVQVPEPRCLQWELGMIDSLMLVPPIEGGMWAHLKVFGRRDLTTIVGARSRSEIPFNIQVPTGSVDDGKYNMSLTVSDNDMEMFRGLHQEAARLIGSANVLDNVVSTDRSATGKAFPSRIQVKVFMDHTRVWHVDNNGSHRTGSLADLRTRRPVQSEVRVTGLNSYTDGDMRLRWRLCMVCQNIFMFDRDNEYDECGLPIFNKLGTFTRAIALNLSGVKRKADAVCS